MLYFWVAFVALLLPLASGRQSIICKLLRLQGKVWAGKFV